MTTPADLEALGIIANAETQEYVLAVQRYDVLQGTRQFTTSPAQGAELLSVSQDLYTRWHNMMAAEQSVSAAQTARYALIADMIIEARKQHELEAQNRPNPQAATVPVVN